MNQNELTLAEAHDLYARTLLAMDYDSCGKHHFCIAFHKERPFVIAIPFKFLRQSNQDEKFKMVAILARQVIDMGGKIFIVVNEDLPFKSIKLAVSTSRWEME